MLILYGFIITPVALWHSHACDGRSQVSEQTSGGQADGVDDSCMICKHVYSSHISGESVHLTVNAIEFRSYRETFRKSIPHIFTGHSDTRGSPFVASFIFFS